MLFIIIKLRIYFANLLLLLSNNNSQINLNIFYNYITYYIQTQDMKSQKQSKIPSKRPIGSSSQIAGLKKAVKKQPQVIQQEVVHQEQDQDNQNKLSDVLKLSDKQLNQEMPTRMLVPNNPQAPVNISLYDYAQRKYKSNELIDQLVIHFALEGDLIHVSSNQFKGQQQIEDVRKTTFNQFKNQAELQQPGSGKNVQAIKQSMRNKFNFKSRQAQTTYPQIRQKGASTCPPSTDIIKGQVTQWQIFDTYIQQFKKQGKQDQKPGHDKDHGKHQNQNKTDKQESTLYSTSFKRCMKIMERMVKQNEEDKKYNDYKYYWQQGQELNPTQGQLLPIWRFSYQKKKKHVTSICWNPKYPDLFAISLGSYDFAKQKAGQILVWSLKNVSHPQYIYTCDTGVMCLDFHPQSPALLAVGLYDGTVLVYDVRNKHKKPIYQSTVRTQKHTDPVWQVRWNEDISKNFNFFSISSDGRVMNWSLMKNKLQPEEVIKLKLVGKSQQQSNFIGLACGLCFDFNKFDTFSFLVGTEEGKIHKCSRAYSGQYQQTYIGHLLAVYKVRWNNYHPTTFISASADWTIRIWDSTYPSQIMSFDLGMIVVDVMWAPYSSTVFACATLEKVYVYDLNVEKHKSLADHKPVKNPKLTNLSFNYKDPILLLGDTYGGITLIKLSPNLTKRGPQQKKELQNTKNAPPPLTPKQIDDFQREKMNSLLALVTKWERE